MRDARYGGVARRHDAVRPVGGCAQIAVGRADIPAGIERGCGNDDGVSVIGEISRECGRYGARHVVEREAGQIIVGGQDRVWRVERGDADERNALRQDRRNSCAGCLERRVGRNARNTAVIDVAVESDRASANECQAARPRKSPDDNDVVAVAIDRAAIDVDGNAITADKAVGI